MLEFLSQLSDMWLDIGLYYLGFAIVFSLLCRRYKCNPEMDYWKQGNVVVDALYWFVVPLFSRYVRLVFLVLGATYILGLEASEQDAYFANGYGPVATLPVWLQVVLILVISDVYLYAAHRFFHSRALWKVHAIHHSPKVLDWPSAARFHPINTWCAFTLIDAVMMLIGFAPQAFVILAPINALYSAFVHANLNWTLGPLRYVFASPVFHRWHHTSVAEGGSKNFAPTFPMLDILFGTYYMPKGVLPKHYGVDDPSFPQRNIVDQLLYPFK